MLGRFRQNVALPLIAGLLLTACVPLAAAQTAVVIDHNCTDLGQIPPYWITQAKNLTFHYAHTSHGSQVNTGADVLESQHETYKLLRRTSSTEGLPAQEDPPGVRMYDGNPPETYIEPGDYWATTDGQNRTRTVASTGNYNLSMWSWCGQQSSNSEATTQAYLDTMAQFETEYPAMRFILMTGHTDGSGVDGNLNQRNQQVRDFAIAHNMVVFDFADIESYDPDGNGYLALGCNDNGDYSGGNWCTQWCAANPGSELCATCSCAHSQPLICNLKGRAFWWMMARLAGWPGPEVDKLGDTNCDGQADVFDIDSFVAAVTQPGTYAASYTSCDIANADCNTDGAIDIFDVDVFVDLIVGD
ncbi:MAG: hypothetical protein JXO22_04675 [Phycisphaerae bacterium]|nr:hypothetical protein [Phycisphaerae bacterium]